MKKYPYLKNLYEFNLSKGYQKNSEMFNVQKIVNLTNATRTPKGVQPCQSHSKKLKFSLKYIWGFSFITMFKKKFKKAS